MKFGTIIEVFYTDADQWCFRTVNRGHVLGDIARGYPGKHAAIRDAKRWHPGVPITILPKEA